jgi:hypothetical protein
MSREFTHGIGAGVAQEKTNRDVSFGEAAIVHVLNVQNDPLRIGHPGERVTLIS